MDIFREAESFIAPQKPKFTIFRMKKSDIDQDNIDKMDELREEVTSSFYEAGAHSLAETLNGQSPRYLYWVASDGMDKWYAGQLADAIEMGLTRVGVADLMSEASQALSDIRNRYRQEIHDRLEGFFKKNKKMTYDELIDLLYSDMVATDEAGYIAATPSKDKPDAPRGREGHLQARYTPKQSGWLDAALEATDDV